MAVPIFSCHSSIAASWLLSNISITVDDSPRARGVPDSTGFGTPLILGSKPIANRQYENRTDLLCVVAAFSYIKLDQFQGHIIQIRTRLVHRFLSLNYIPSRSTVTAAQDKTAQLNSFRKMRSNLSRPTMLRFGRYRLSVAA